MTNIEDIPIPEELTEVQKAEYTAYKNAMIQLEKEWELLQENQNLDQKACYAIIDDAFNRKNEKIKEKFEIRQDIINKQHRNETEKVEKEFKAAKETLYDRLILAYSQSDQNITTQLRDLKGKDYTGENSIEFPPIQSDPQMMTRTKQPEELKFRLPTSDCERDIRKIQQIYESELQ